MRAVVSALIAAEELGITQQNVAAIGNASDDPEVLRLLGEEGSLGELLGLPLNWAIDVIEAVGNYGEIYDRVFDPRSGTVGTGRGLNALWTEGGLLYSVPFR